MIIEIVVAGAAVAYAIHKHITVATIKADVKAAVTKAEASVATIKADLSKYL